MKKILDYELIITDKDFTVNYKNEVCHHIAALAMTRDNLNYVIGNLKKSVEQAPGKKKNIYRDRLGKFQSAVMAVDLVIQSAIAEYKPFYDKEKENEPVKEGPK